MAALWTKSQTQILSCHCGHLPMLFNRIPPWASVSLLQHFSIPLSCPTISFLPRKTIKVTALKLCQIRPFSAQLPSNTPLSSFPSHPFTIWSSSNLLTPCRVFLIPVLSASLCCLTLNYQFLFMCFDSIWGHVFTLLTGYCHSTRDSLML